MSRGWWLLVPGGAVVAGLCTCATAISSIVPKLASSENPLFSQASMSVAACESRNLCRLYQPITRWRTRSVTGARCVAVSGRRQKRRQTVGAVRARQEDAVGDARVEMSVTVAPRAEAVEERDGAESSARDEALIAAEALIHIATSRSQASYLLIGWLSAIRWIMSLT